MRHRQRLGPAFCRRCGTWLVADARGARPAGPAAHPATAPLVGGTTGAYTGDLTRGTIAFRILSVVIVLALVAVVLTLAGWHPHPAGHDLVGHVLGSGRVDG